MSSRSSPFSSSSSSSSSSLSSSSSSLLSENSGEDDGLSYLLSGGLVLTTAFHPGKGTQYFLQRIQLMEVTQCTIKRLYAGKNTPAEKVPYEKLFLPTKPSGAIRAQRQIYALASEGDTYRLAEVQKVKKDSTLDVNFAVRDETLNVSVITERRRRLVPGVMIPVPFTASFVQKISLRVANFRNALFEFPSPSFLPTEANKVGIKRTAEQISGKVSPDRKRATLGSTTTSSSSSSAASSVSVNVKIIPQSDTRSVIHPGPSASQLQAALTAAATAATAVPTTKKEAAAVSAEPAAVAASAAAAVAAPPAYNVTVSFDDRKRKRDLSVIQLPRVETKLSTPVHPTLTPLAVSDIPFLDHFSSITLDNLNGREGYQSAAGALHAWAAAKSLSSKVICAAPYICYY